MQEWGTQASQHGGVVIVKGFQVAEDGDKPQQAVSQIEGILKQESVLAQLEGRDGEVYEPTDYPYRRQSAGRVKYG